MTRFVADASVTLAWCLADELDEYAEKTLKRLDASSEVCVPAHWSLEVSNGLVIAERRSRIAASDVADAIELLAGIPFRVDARTAEKSMNETLALARAHKLSAYDAAYLELCVREALPLATLDRNLWQACAACGVALYEPT